MPSAGEQLVELLIEARQTGRPLTLAPELEPADAAAADAVQLAVAGRFGGSTGYKVFQVGDVPGAWGAILGSRIFAAPARVHYLTAPLKVEAEIAFAFGRDLSGKPDGAPYTAAEVEAAVAGAFVAFEIIESRLAGEPKPSPLASRADMMSNWGLVRGPLLADWRRAVHPDVAVRLDIAGKTVVDRRGGHPSGDPAHPLVWLANALASAGRGLKAGEVVTTGAFGGSHPVAPGQTAIATIEGFGSIAFTLETA